MNAIHNLLSLLPCLIPPYALRLNRVFGTKRVGWVLFSAFSLLAVLQLMRALQPMGLGLDAGVTLDLLNFLVPVLLLTSLFHIESLFRERLRTEQQELKMRAELENQVRERTAALDQANDELQREITMRRQGEEELRKSKEQYLFLFDENPQPMWIYDLSTLRFLAFNAAALHHYGYSRDEFRNLTAADLCPRSEMDAFVADSAAACLGAPRQKVWRHCRKDGSVVEVETTALDLNYSGWPARLILASDITAQQQLQRQLLQAQKTQVTEHIAGGVGDRFSRFLTAIEGDAFALSQESPDAAAERLKRIIATTASASRISAQLMALAGRRAMQPQPLELNALVEKQVGFLTGQLGGKISLERLYWDNLPPIVGDPVLVQELLFHLVDNAREAMPDGGALTLSTATVVVDEAHARRHEAARPGSFVCLGVSDSGSGMTDDVRSRLFEPFFTTKDPAKASGLGLASVAGLVKQHGGWVELSSKPNFGTRVTVFFPAAPTEAPQCNLAALPSPESLSCP